MLKSELLEKLKDINDDTDINETILSIEDFAKSSSKLDGSKLTVGKLDVSKLTVEDFKNVLENNQMIKGYYTSQVDSAISKAINSHDEKFKKDKLPKIIEDELKKRSNDGLSPEQIEIKELKAQMEAMKAEKEANDLLNSNRTKLKEAKLSEDLAKYIKEDSDIEFFKNLITESVNNGVKDKINNSSYTPPSDSNLGGGKITWDMVQENPSLMSDYIKQNN